MLYVGLAGARAALAARDGGGRARPNVLFLLLVVWAGDVGAYLVGRLVGGPRLAPRISPGKTWSGAVGGLLAAVAVGLLAAHLRRPAGETWRRVGLVAALLGIVRRLAICWRASSSAASR